MRQQKVIVLSTARIKIISTHVMYHQAVSFTKGQEQKQVVVGCAHGIDTLE